LAERRRKIRKYGINCAAVQIAALIAICLYSFGHMASS
jgi:hypothetical protein